MTKNDGKARLTLSAAAQKVLEEAASPRKRGEFVSRLLLEYGAGKIGANALNGIDGIDLEEMKLQMMGLASVTKMLEARLLKVERQLAAVIAGR